MKVNVGFDTGVGKVAKILHTATILYRGWASDNEAWVVELENGKRLVMCTSHGSLYPTRKREMVDKLRETEQSAEQIRKLIELMGWNDA